MSLSSPLFLLFLAVCTAVYYLLPQRARNPFLLLASYVFYCWKLTAYAAVLPAVTLLSYFAARAAGRARTAAGRRAALLVGVLGPLAALAVCKYCGFFLGGVSQLLGLFGVAWTAPALGLVQPVGISFFTFMAVGYAVDVWRGKVQPERNFVDFALFLSFFPQVLSGPIGRADELLPQFRQPHTLCEPELVAGLQRFLVGAFKKVVVADGLGRLVDAVYEAPAGFGTLGALLAVCGFGIQLYCDFSGYTDMALGAARMLGFRLRENFFAPYQADSFRELWQRWHMSLTEWLRDYLYFPLGGSRKGRGRKALNILIVFLVSGLWHGANLTFLVWGLLNGLVRLAEDLLPAARRAPGRFAAGLRRAGTFALFCLIFVFFRAPSFGEAGALFASLFHFVAPGAFWALLKTAVCADLLETTRFAVFYLVLLALAVALVWRFDRRIDRSVRAGAPEGNPLAGRSLRTRWALYWSLGLVTALFWLLTTAGGVVSFIYANY